MYIKGGYGSDIKVQYHEMGHTQGLSHSGFNFDEYGDRSDVMGDDGINAMGYICTNAPNMYRIGWSRAIASLNATATNLAPVWTIPMTSVSDVNYIVLNYSVPGIPFNTYFVSARARTATYDNILSSDLNNKV